MRHAKADWSVEVVHDRHRPLEARGHEDAGLLGRFLADLGQVPDAVLSSPAERAEQTARIAAEAGGWGIEPQVVENLYDTPPWKVIGEIQQQPDEFGSLLLAFHEPTCSETLSDLVGHASVKMPTGALARVDLRVDSWQEVEPDTGVLVWLTTPKILKCR